MQWCTRDWTLSNESGHNGRLNIKSLRSLAHSVDRGSSRCLHPSCKCDNVHFEISHSLSQCAEGTKTRLLSFLIRITVVAPWHVFLHTFFASILRVGCPLQTTGLVVARARLQRLCRSSTQIQLSTLCRNGCWKNSAGLPTVRSTLLSLSVLFVGCCWITPNQRQRIRKCPVAWVTEQRRCDIWCLPEYNQALLSGLHTHYIFNPPRVTLLAQLMLVSDTISLVPPQTAGPCDGCGGGRLLPWAWKRPISLRRLKNHYCGRTSEHSCPVFLPTLEQELARGCCNRGIGGILDTTGEKTLVATE